MDVARPHFEEGGLNLYGFVNNKATAETDALGLKTTVKVQCVEIKAKGKGIFGDAMLFLSGAVHCSIVASCDETGVTKRWEVTGPGKDGNGSKKDSDLKSIKEDSWKFSYDVKYPDAAEKCCDIFKCLETAFSKSNPGKYDPLANNSNTFSHSLLDTCGLKIIVKRSVDVPPRAFGW